MTTYQNARNRRRHAVTRTGRFRGGKLVPVMAVAVRPSEGGMLSQSITMELDPIAGRLITQMEGELYSVAVPVQAIDAMKNPEGDYAGLTEVIREKLLTGNPLFGIEEEGEISKRCKVNPRSVGGVKMVNEAVRLAHNAAVNFLRQRKYVYAALLSSTNTAITPALIGKTVLERMNGVLDPDDRINGSFNLSFPTVKLPVDGIGISASDNTPLGTSTGNVKESGTDSWVPYNGQWATAHDGVNLKVRTNTTTGVKYPDVSVTLNDAVSANLSLVDMYNAETRDRLTRAMRQIVDDNPQYGEEMVLRWSHGLSVDTGKTPFLLAEERAVFGRDMVQAMDKVGIEDDVMRSDMALQLSFTVPVPKTELGMIIITFATVKPDETLESQPDPFLSDVWGADNFVADELALDPVPVTIRDLDANCSAGQENTVVMYTGLNALKQTYVSYGLGRYLDPTTIENKTAIWQLQIPLSVTPETILYPDYLDHYPFSNGGTEANPTEVVTYTISTQAMLATPMIIGPTPVEELAVIGASDVFEEEA